MLGTYLTQEWNYICLHFISSQSNMSVFVLETKMDKTKGQGEMEHMPKEMLKSKLQFPLFQVSIALIAAWL